MSISGNSRFIAVAYDGTLELWNPLKNTRFMHGLNDSVVIKKLECNNDGGIALTTEGKVIFYNHERNVYPLKDKIVDIASGENDVVLVTNKGKFIKFGKSKKLSTISSAPPPCSVSIGAAKIAVISMGKLYIDEKEIPHHCGIKQVVVGGGHTVFLDEKGHLYGYGNNSKGQLCHFNPENYFYNEPVRILFFGEIKKIAAGHEHTLILDNNGKVWGFGSNTSKQLGDNYSSDYHFEFLDILPDEENKVLDIYARCNFTFILKENGDLEQFGNRV